jgi:hypothetical protein
MASPYSSQQLVFRGHSETLAQATDLRPESLRGHAGTLAPASDAVNAERSGVVCSLTKDDGTHKVGTRLLQGERSH